MIFDYNRIFQAFQQKALSSIVLLAIAPLILQIRFNKLCITTTASLEKSFVLVTLTQAFEGSDVALFALLIGKSFLNMDLQALMSIWSYGSFVKTRGCGFDPGC